MKKIITIISLLIFTFFIYFDRQVNAQEISLEECVYTNINDAVLQYELDAEKNDNYTIVFKVENQIYKHNILEYQYANFKNRQWICRTDLIENTTEVILMKFDISRTSRTSFYLELICMLEEDISQIFRITCLTEYDLSSILNDEIKNANEILEIQSLIEARFNYLTSILDIEPYDSGINEDEVVKTSMNQEGISYSYLQDNTKARNYEVFNNSSFLDQFVVCGDDNIIEIIPLDIFFMNGPHLACGSGYGYYVNVMDETPSGDIKKCEVFVFEIKNYKEKDENFSKLEIIPLFQQNFKAVSYSYDTSQIYSELFKISGKGRHVVSKGVDAPFFAISNPSETILMELIGEPNIGDTDFDSISDKGPCLQNISYSVEDPKDYHADLDDVSGNAFYNNLSNLVYYLSDFHPAISLTNKVMDVLEVLTGYRTQIENNRAELASQTEKTRTLNFKCTAPKPRSATFGGNLNHTYVYIGEADNGTAVNKKERFYFQNNYYYGEGLKTFKVQELITFCLNRYNYSIYRKYYSREKILAVSMDLYMDDCFQDSKNLKENENYNFKISDDNNRLLGISPSTTGLYNIKINSNKQVQICIFDNYGRLLYDNYIQENLNNILLDFNKNFKYFILIKGYGSNLIIDFNITPYNFTPNIILKDNTYSFMLDNQSYQIFQIEISKFLYYRFTTYSNTDTKLYVYRNGIKIGYNDDYLYYTDDSDPDYNSQLDFWLNEGTYYVLIQNISSSDTIYLEVN